MSPSPTSLPLLGKRNRPESPQSDSSNALHDFPCRSRNCSSLYAQDATVHCALHKLCVPCAYKVGCFDVALDTEFTRAVPNKRPEECPRARASPIVRQGTLGYHKGQSVLTVGDGDLSFSLAVARLLSSNDNGNSGRLIATSYESQETLERIYPNFLETLSELEGLGATVAYEVDATRLSETLPVLNTTESLRFHRIIWNFPCTAIQQGKDGQNDAMEDNKDLVRRFVRGSRHLLHDNGEIHMSHKTKPPFNQWKLEEMAIEQCEGEPPAVEYRGRVVLDRFCLPPYIPRKALDRKSFPCHDACIFIFGVADASASGDSMPSSIPKESVGNSNSKEGMSADLEPPIILPVNRSLIAKIREALLDNAAKRGNKNNKKGKYKKRKYNKRS